MSRGSLEAVDDRASMISHFVSDHRSYRNFSFFSEFPIDEASLSSNIKDCVVSAFQHTSLSKYIAPS